MLCSPPPATTLASSCAGSEGFCAPCCRRSSQRSRIHNRPKTGRTLLLHERLLRHTMAKYGWQVEGPLIPLPFDVSVGGGRGAAPGISRALPPCRRAKGRL